MPVKTAGLQYLSCNMPKLIQQTQNVESMLG